MQNSKVRTMLPLLLFWVAILLCACSKKEEVSFSLEEKNAERQIPVMTEKENLESEANQTADPVKEDDENGREESWYVYVCGAVKVPGVYKVVPGSRIFEAIELAGGFAENASEDYVNQAQPLEDGARIEILTEYEAEKARQAELEAEQESRLAAESAADGKINLNTATKEQLCTLPGIGATRADSIIAYRDQAGSFQTVEDIMKVNGIKSSVYEKIKEQIKVE
ncbi:MAG: helix-hairpin-helix domain-containing protein [Lachnospiraceae bacterium]|nr:helix-hairpin-helix domain-containing protein [Lachnospiraceae bacterium]